MSNQITTHNNLAEMLNSLTLKKSTNRKSTNRLGNVNVNTYHNTINYRLRPLKTEFIDKTCNIIEKYIIKVLSDGASQTMSKVYLVKEDNISNKSYIIKETPYNTSLFIRSSILQNNPEEYLQQYTQLYSILSEGIIYNKVVNTLINNNITPYIILGHGVKQCDTQKKIFLINETGGDNTIKILKLQEFFESYSITYELLLHILFQIVYTLSCFDKIKLQHNDLHINNILVFIRKKNIFNTDLKNFDSLYYFKYGNKPNEEFLLLNLGIDIRIYDFDRSFKDTANTQFNNLNFIILPEKYILSEHNQPSYTLTDLENSKYIFKEKTDLFRILSDIYKVLKDLNKDNKDNKDNILECLFILHYYLNTSTLNKLIGKLDFDITTFKTNYNLSSFDNIFNRELLFLNGKYKDKDKDINLFIRAQFVENASTYFKSPLEYLLNIIELLRNTELYKSKTLDKSFYNAPIRNKGKIKIIDSFDLTLLNKTK
jgi:hypothetical protein